ncbi:unnamed protein product [Calicophoron daubneyi]
MDEQNVSELGISKNLLQMNFMRRTLVAKEKLVSAAAPDLLPNPEEYSFKLPASVKDHLKKLACIIKQRPEVRHECSVFRIHGLPPGFRKSFGGFNPSSRLQSVEGFEEKNTTKPKLNYFMAKYNLDEFEEQRLLASETKSSVDRRGMRRSLRNLADGPPTKRSKKRKSYPN